MLKHAVLAAGLGLALPARAGWYEVEVLVFARATPEALQGEAWPEAVPVPAAADAVDILAPALDEAALEPPAPAPAGEAAAEQPYRPLPDSALQLQAAQARLAQAGYQPLVHLAWRQDGAAPALPLRIYGGTNYAPAAPLLPAGTDPAVPAEAAAETVITPPQVDTTTTQDSPVHAAAPVWQMEGVLRLSGASQPEFSADLVLRLPATVAPDATPGSVPALKLYGFQAGRRLKSQDIHYLDHPLMGALVQLRPYEPPAASDYAPAPQPVPPENKP